MTALFLRCLAIGGAGFLGALLRYTLASAIGRFPTQFPLATFIINITGSFFLGWFLTYFANRGISDTMKLAIATGFVGAYTTFSTWMWESASLARDSANLLALANLLGSLIAGVLAVYGGIMLARWM